MCGDGGGDGGGESCEVFVYDYSEATPSPGLHIAGLPPSDGFGGIPGTYYDDSSGECPY